MRIRKTFVVFFVVFLPCTAFMNVLVADSDGDGLSDALDKDDDNDGLKDSGKTKLILTQKLG